MDAQSSALLIQAGALLRERPQTPGKGSLLGFLDPYRVSGLALELFSPVQS